MCVCVCYIGGGRRLPGSAPLMVPVRRIELLRNIEYKSNSICIYYYICVYIILGKAGTCRGRPR